MENNKLVIIWVVIVIVAGVFIFARGKKETKVAQTPTNQKNAKTEPTETPSIPMIINKNKKYTAILKTTEGDITIELTVDKTPITVNNFVSLAKKNFYDNTVFHRVIKGFMIQGGDPKGNGTGGPGYKFADEPFTGDYKRGTVAMANAGPNTNGSQFFIMHEDNKDLPKKYVIFGQVTVGLDVVDKIAEAEVEVNPNSGQMEKPVKPASINSVEIIEK